MLRKCIFIRTRRKDLLVLVETPINQVHRTHGHFQPLLYQAKQSSNAIKTCPQRSTARTPVEAGRVTSLNVSSTFYACPFCLSQPYVAANLPCKCSPAVNARAPFVPSGPSSPAFVLTISLGIGTNWVPSAGCRKYAMLYRPWRPSLAFRGTITRCTADFSKPFVQ